MPNGPQSNDRVPCSKATKELLRRHKRGGETYDQLFEKMMAQYDPDAALADGGALDSNR